MTGNIARYTVGRSTPTGLATEARALDEEPLQAAVPMPPDDVDGRGGERVGLLVHEEHLEPESLLAKHPPLAVSIRAVAVAVDPAQRSPAEVALAVEASTAGAVVDAARDNEPWAPFTRRGGRVPDPHLVREVDSLPSAAGRLEIGRVSRRKRLGSASTITI